MGAFFFFFDGAVCQVHRQPLTSELGQIIPSLAATHSKSKTALHVQTVSLKGLVTEEETGSDNTTLQQQSPGWIHTTVQDFTR